jgi:hypothetical protein
MCVILDENGKYNLNTSFFEIEYKIVNRFNKIIANGYTRCKIVFPLLWRVPAQTIIRSGISNGGKEEILIRT